MPAPALIGLLLVVGATTSASAEDRWSLKALTSETIPVDAVAIAVADTFAAIGCSSSAKSCSQPTVRYGRAGAPALACAIERNGGVVCWSMADLDLLEGDLRLTRPTSATGYADLAVGRTQICLLEPSGELMCLHYAWDQTNDGWLFTAPQPRPGRYRTVSAGGSTFCASRQEGGVACWPAGARCQNLAESVTPGPIAMQCREDSSAVAVDIDGTGPVRELTVSIGGGCAVGDDERLICWGGPAGTAPSHQGTPVSQLGRVASVSVTWSRTCATRRGGSLVCWPTTSTPHQADHQGTANSTTIARDAGSVAVRGETVCWLDRSGSLLCQDDGGTSRRFDTGVVELALGEQLCARKNDGSVRCWAESYRRSLHEGETVINTYVTLRAGGGAAGLGGDVSRQFDAGLRGHLLLGPVHTRSQATAWPEWALGPILELRSRGFDTLEPSAGVELITKTTKNGPWLGFSAVGGYAWRPHRPESVVGLSTSLLAIGPLWRGHDYLQGRWLRNFRIGSYLSVRYGLRYRRVEVTAGVEVEAVAPWAAL